MLYKTRAIALSYIKFKETSIIAKLYTEEFGLQTYIQNSVRSAKAKPKMAFFQPLTLLDLVVYHKMGQEIHRISELKCLVAYQSLQTDFRKITVASLLTEIISKCVHEGDLNAELFEFLASSFIHFDKQNVGYQNFHIHFLFELTNYLGFHPQSFDELKSQLISYRTTWLNVFEDDSLKFICVSLIEGMNNIEIDGHQRRILIDMLLDFYQSHIENFGEIKSLKVLREL